LREKLIFFEDKIIDDLDSIKINFVEEENNYCKENHDLDRNEDDNYNYK
jgi:hypothetical protein